MRRLALVLLLAACTVPMDDTEIAPDKLASAEAGSFIPITVTDSETGEVAEDSMRIEGTYVGCGSSDIEALAGQPVSAMPASGPWKQRRILRPGDAATMDYSQDRLTVTLDAQDRIETAFCG